MNKRSFFLLVVSVAVLLPGAAGAHHSMAIYDTQQEVTVQGTVTRVRWSNPHVYIYVDETQDSGQVVNW